MVLGLKAPYSDDLTRTTDSSVIIENWIRDNWAHPTILATDIAFGQPPKFILQGGKDIVIRCNTFYTKRTSQVIGGARYEFIDHVNIEVYTINHTNKLQRDPKAISIMKYLESVFIINQGSMPQGIFTLQLMGSDLRQDPIRDDVSKVIIWVEIRYIADIVTLP